LKAIASESLLLHYAVQAAKSNGDQPLVKNVIELDTSKNTLKSILRPLPPAYWHNVAVAGDAGWPEGRK